MNGPLTDEARAALLAELPRMIAAGAHDAHLLAVVDGLLGSAADPLSLAPLGPVAAVEEAALHARALFLIGRDADAICLLADIAALDPDFPALVWLAGVPTTTLVSLEPAAETRFVTALRALADDGRLVSLLAPLSSREARALRAEVARRVGQVELAIELCTGLDLPAAQRTLRRAIADRLLDEGRFAEAATRALEAAAVFGDEEREPPDVVASRTLCLALQVPLPDADLRPMQALAHAGNRRARALLERVDPPPFFGLLPLPFDEATQQLRALWPTLPIDEPWLIRWEGVAPAPSNELALALAAARVGTTVTFDHAACAPRSPTPKRPAATGELYDRLVYLATLPGDADELFHAARAVARATRFDEAPAWLSVGTHLPLPPLDQTPFDPFAWVQRCQLAAVSVVAQLDEGWAGSLRRVLLGDLLRGPSDWLVGFAAIAAARITRRERADRDELAALVRAAENRSPEACWSQFALASAGLYAGGGDAEDRRRWWQTQSRWLRFGATVTLLCKHRAPAPRCPRHRSARSRHARWVPRPRGRAPAWRRNRPGRTGSNAPS